MAASETDFEGKRILITGATDGLGRHLARELTASGAAVLVHGRNRSKGRSLVEEIDAEAFYHADFAVLEEVRGLADDVVRDHDGLDVLINNAGIGFGSPGSGRELSRDGHELRFQVNYLRRRCRRCHCCHGGCRC